MITWIFEHFTLHLCFTTLKLFPLSIVQYPVQRAQNCKPATDLKFIVSIPPENKVWGVYKNHLVRPTIRLFVFCAIGLKNVLLKLIVNNWCAIVNILLENPDFIFNIYHDANWYDTLRWLLLQGWFSPLLHM